MGESSGLNTAEESICGVENRSETIIQNAAQEGGEVRNMEVRGS